MNDIPISLDDLEKMAKTHKTSTSNKKGLTGKKKAPKRKPDAADKDTSKTTELTFPPEHVYQVHHYYVRPSDTFSAVKREASAEAELHNVNVRFIVHDHAYGSECGNCTVVTGANSEESS